MAFVLRPLMAEEEVVFRLDAWDLAAAVALVLFALGVYLCWTGTHGSPAADRLRKAAWLVIASTLGLMAYAWHRAEPIFLVGELVLLIAAVALRVSLKHSAARHKPHAARGFPVVAPDSAEWKVAKPTTGPSPADEGISPPVA